MRGHSASLLFCLWRYFEVVSSDRKKCVFLRAKDHAMAQAWYNAIQTGSTALLSSAKAELKALQPSLDVTHIGWIIEQVRDTRTHAHKHINTHTCVCVCVCVCTCVCVCVCLWHTRTHICIMTWVWHVLQGEGDLRGHFPMHPYFKRLINQIEWVFLRK